MNIYCGNRGGRPTDLYYYYYCGESRISEFKALVRTATDPDRTRRVYKAKIRAELISTDKPLSLHTPSPLPPFRLYIILYVDRTTAAAVIKF